VTWTMPFGTVARTSVDSPPVFPSMRYGSAAAYGVAYFEEWARAVESLDLISLQRAADLLLDAYVAGATIFSCGNGGSAAIADHLQCDHLKGVRTGTDLLPRVTSLASNVDLITAIANDIGYEDVFAYQLQSQARHGDVLVAISSSGASPNVLRALRWAQAHGIATVALTGFSGGEARRLADVSVHVACSNYGIVEDLHQATVHSIAQYIRQSRMTDEAIAATRF
jgi:phosphoheptose isomerase